jgi:hypothetical protein
MFTAVLLVSVRVLANLWTSRSNTGLVALSILPKRALVAYLYFTSVRQYEGGLCVYFHCSSIFAVFG